jgi:hypothetical protein
VRFPRRRLAWVGAEWRWPLWLFTMTSIGCRAGHPMRGPSLEESIELGSWAPLEQMERRAAKRRPAPAERAHAGTPRQQQASGTPRRWEGRSPMATPPTVSALRQAHLLFGRTHATRPEQPSPRSPSQAARGHSMRCGRSWSPIMQRHHHLDSWEPAACTSTRHVSKLADVSEKFHKKPVGDNNSRRVNAHAALLRMLAKESKAACEPPADPREEVRRRLERREQRANEDRWALRPPNEATHEQQHAAAVNGSAKLMDARELAASWAANETHGSSNNGWTLGFAASARGRSSIYAHRDAARSRSLTERLDEPRNGSRRPAVADRTPQSHGQLLGSHTHSGEPRSPDWAATAAQAEAEVLRQLLGSTDAL